MNLFTYLLSKKGKNSLVYKGDLFAYLLGKQTPKEVKTATGTTISITDATKAKIVSLTLSKESMQDGTPTPENPIEVKTVKGYRNLAPSTLYNTQVLSSGVIQNSTNRVSNVEINGTSSLYLSKGTYTLSIENLDYCVAMTKNSNNEILDNYATRWHELPFTFTLTQDGYLYYTGRKTNNSNISYSDYIPQLVEGTEELPYVPYGNNYIAITNTNGTDTNYYTIPLNDNEIVGIGNYKDELIVDKNGKCWLNKKTGKDIFTGIENWAIRNDVIVSGYECYRNKSFDYSLLGDLTKAYSNYFGYVTSGNVANTFRLAKANEYAFQCVINENLANNVDGFKTWLSTHNTEVYYVLATENLIDLNYTVDIRLFNGVNNISNSDDMDMTLEYY